MLNDDGQVTPGSLPTQSGKTAYPPLQWRPLRVMRPLHKFAFIAGLLIVWPTVVRLVGLVVSPTAVGLISNVLWPFAIIALARSFRGPDEPIVPPRPWWRLTARPPAGWVLGAIYTAGELIGLIFPVPGSHDVVAVVGEVCGLFIGLAFLNSSIRLTLQRRRLQ
ncbi:hypothetical protein [Leifsonia shinshuensis]|nr:hypothetical protein [Leifsonia shinshuensis]